MHDENTSETTNTHYLGGFQYTEDHLDFFPHAEGYVNVLDFSEFNYIYTHKDHLGNIRLKYTRDPGTGETEILEENHYYPFGLTHKGYNGAHFILWQAPGTGIQLVPVTSLAEDKYKYKFNGMEYQDELDLNYYDFGARNYDPALGRWMNIDPLAEHPSQINRSPYVYAWNTPTYFADSDGKFVQVVWGAIIGASVEYTAQVVTNAIKGEGLVDSFIKVDLGSIAIGAVTGAATGGLSSLKVIGSTAKVYRAVAASSVVVAGSTANQFRKNKHKAVNPIPVIADVFTSRLPKTGNKWFDFIFEVETKLILENTLPIDKRPPHPEPEPEPEPQPEPQPEPEPSPTPSPEPTPNPPPSPEPAPTPEPAPGPEPLPVIPSPPPFRF